MFFLGSLFKDLIPVVVKTGSVVNIVSGDGTKTGTIIDGINQDRVLIEAFSGNINSGDHEIQVFHGDDSGLSDGEQVLASDINGEIITLTSADAHTVKTFELTLRKRYYRIDLVTTGFGASGIAIALGVVASKVKYPVQT